MIDFESIRRLANFNTRIKVKNDNKVYCSLCFELNNYCNHLKEIDSQLAATAILLKDGIIECFEKYYQGNLVEACKTMNSLITTHQDDLYIHSLAGDNTNITMYSDVNKDMYRGVIGDYTQKIDREYMLHIPFNKRQLVTTQRFSIPGVPCLYLGQSLLTVWEELNRPTLDNLFVSRFELDKDIKVLDLALNWFDLESNKESLTPKLIRTYLLNNILRIACHIHVTENNRSFKSEYIIPQLVFIAISNTNLAQGIRYTSIKAPNDSYIFANYAFIAVQENLCNTNAKLSDSLKKISKCTYPINIGLYQKAHPLNSLDGRNLYKRSTPVVINKEYQTNYKYTDFYELETAMYYDEQLSLKGFSTKS